MSQDSTFCFSGLTKKLFGNALSCLIALLSSLLTDRGTIWKLMRFKYYGSKLSDTGITVTDGTLGKRDRIMHRNA